MNKRSLVIVLIALIVAPVAFFGCRGKVEKPTEEMSMETSGALSQTEEIQGAMPGPEPAETVATETIPPTATPPMAETSAAKSLESQNRDKDIQKALKNAGFYSGSIDGKIGPKTTKAIKDFQSSKGLKVDGKVGQRTWAELEKYLTQQ